MTWVSPQAENGLGESHLLGSALRKKKIEAGLVFFFEKKVPDAKMIFLKNKGK